MMDEEVFEGSCNMIGIFHVLIRQHFCMCVEGSGFERPNHPPAKNTFYTGLGTVERDCEHTRNIPQCALIKALLT